MALLHDVDGENIDEEVQERLENRDRDFLYRLFQLVRDPERDDLDQGREREPDCVGTPEWRQKLAATYSKEVRRIFDTYDKLDREKVKLEPAVEFLSEWSDIKPEKLQLDSLYDLVLLLKEEDLTDIDRFISGSRMTEYKNRNRFVIDTSVALDDVGDSIETFHRQQPTATTEDPTTKVDMEFNDGDMAGFRVITQKNTDEETVRFFAEDTSADEENAEPASNTGPPSIETVSFRPVKEIRLLLKPEDESGQTRVVLTDSLPGWKIRLEALFKELFGVSELYQKVDPASSTVASNIEQEFTDNVGKDDDPVDVVQEAVEERAEEAESEVEEKDWPDEWKKDAKQLLDGMNVAGAHADQDAAISLRDFTLIGQGSLGSVLESVNLEEGVKDIMQSVNDENVTFVLNVDGTPVTPDDGQWSREGSGRLPRNKERALELFFDGDAPL